MRIAHISDFHLRRSLPGTAAARKRTSRRMPRLLPLAVSRIRESSPDLVAVTGDLVDYPTYAMHDPDMMALGEEDLHFVRDLFDGFDCPVVYVYGNHDHPGSFRKVFADQALELDVQGTRVLLFLDEEQDMHVPQRLGPERERYRSALADDDPRPQVHIQHYVIEPQFDEGYPLSYAEADSLRDQMSADPRVRLSLSGHWHASGDPITVGATTFATVRAFGESPHYWYLHDVHDNGITTTEHRLFDGSEPKQPAVFLDRDGTINPQPAYRTGPEDMELLPVAAPALEKLRNAGYALVVVTNQTAVGAGYVTPETVGAVNDRMAALLSAEGVELDGVYCAYGDSSSIVPAYRSASPPCKPDPTMILEAAEHLNLDLAASWMVGDSVGDLEAGRNAGCRGSLLVRTGNGASIDSGDLRGAPAVADVAEAADWILGRPDAR